MLQGRLVEARGILERVDVEVDEEGIEGVVKGIDDMVRKREGEVREIWRGFSARWGLGTVGVQAGLEGGGRMDIRWVRPEMEG